MVQKGKSGKPADVERLVDMARTNKVFLSVNVAGEAPPFPNDSDALGQYAPAMIVAWQNDVEKETAALLTTANTILWPKR